MKEIIYRGGVVRFRVPSNWKEEYEATGGGTFYEDRDDSGTLRLNVITFNAPNGGVTKDAESILRNSKEGKTGKLQVLPSGYALLSYNQHVVENGEQLLIYYWRLAQLLSTNSVRMVVFSFTILATQKDDLKMIEQIQLIENEISAVKLAAA